MEVGRDGQSFQGRLGYPRSGHWCFGSHHRCHGVVKLVFGLHHVSQRNNQGQFGDGKANV